MNDRLPIFSRYCPFILQTSNHIRHFGKLLKILQFSQHIHRLFHHFVIILRKRHIHNAIFTIGIPIIFMFIHLDRSIVSKFVGTHHLNIALNGAHRHPFANTFHLVQSIATSLNQIFKSPFSVFISQTIVYCFITNKCIFICWHNVFLSCLM